MALRALQRFLADLKPIAQLGWPMALTQLFIMATGFLDTVMAGRYSAVDLAGVSLGGNIMWPAFLLLTGTTMALTPITSQLRGAGREREVGHQARQALWICLCTSTLLVLVLLNAGQIYAYTGVDPDAARVAAAYLEAVAWGVPPVVIYIALRHVCEGMGKTRPPMIIAASVLPINAFFNYVLIYGEFGFPELGGVGCGIATAVVFWLELLLMLFVVRMPFFRATDFFANFEGPQLRTIKTIALIGVPIGLFVFLEMAVHSVISFMIARIGVNELAAHSIAGNLNWLTYVIPMSIGSAASIRVGYHIGAGDLRAAKRTGGVAFKLSLVYALTVSLLLVLFRYQLVSIYTTDFSVIGIATTLMLFIAVYQIVDDSQAVVIGVLRGYKDTRVPMMFALVDYWFIALPIGHFLAIGSFGAPLGLYGYWVGLTVGLAIVATCVGARLLYLSRDEAHVLRLAAISD
jgi:MATE family multidrug resistance protein